MSEILIDLESTFRATAGPSCPETYRLDSSPVLVREVPKHIRRQNVAMVPRVELVRRTGWGMQSITKQ